ncbi:MAG TPA: TRAM domain-containing protein, partial [Vicinamibacterales bacterium]
MENRCDPDRPVAGGRMLARMEGRVVFVAGAIPGEQVVVRVTRATKHALWADVVEVVTPSPDRRQPPGDPACGGLAYAHVRYERQLQLKSEVIADAFRRLAGITLGAPPPVAGSPERGYRLRARLHVRNGRAGFFREGTHQLCDAGTTGQLLPETLPAVERLLASLGSRTAECDAIVVAENVAATERVLHLEPREGARLDDL